MPYENPFLIREVRQLLRPSRPLRVWAGGLAGAALFYVYLILRIGPDPAARGAWPREALYSLLPIHVGICVMAGIYGGNRVFAEEHRRDTLEGLLLLPNDPAGWLGGKLLFSLLAVMVSWAAGMPFYFLLGVLGLARMETALSLSLQPLLSGVVVLPVILLLPPDYRERMHRMQAISGTRAPQLDRDMLVRSLLLMGLFIALIWGAVWRIAGKSGSGVPFYSVIAREWLVWSMIGVPALLTSLATALATVARDEVAEALASKCRLGMLVLLYYVGLGVMWGLMPPWLRWTAASLFPLCAVALGRAVRRPMEDPLAGEELEWLSARWDDAILTRDLRVYSRYASLRRGLLLKGVLLSLFLAGQACALTWAFERRLTAQVHPVGWALGMVVILVIAFLPAVQASQCWLKEQKAETLQMLLLTPLRSEQMLRSRLLAGFLYYGGVFAPALLLALAAAAWAVARGYWIVAPVLLALSPLPLSLVLSLEAAERPETSSRRTSDAGIAGMLLATLQIGCLLTALWLAVAGSQDVPIAPVRAWAMALALFGVGVGAGWISFYGRARQLEALRAGELEEVGA
jgi:hypothetical protein